MRLPAIAAALLYLRLSSLLGRLRYRLKRLRQPKYLIGAIVGGAYLYFFLFRRVSGSYTRATQAFPADLPARIEDFAALGLLIIVLLSWILPRSRAALAFSEAEIAFLFPAPIKRRTLIHYRLISGQAALALTALVLGLISNRWSFLGGNAATHGIGWWIALATLNLHLTASSFAITRLMDRGVTSLRRRITVVGIVIVTLIAGIAWVVHEIPAPTQADLSGPAAIQRYFAAMLDTGPLAWLLVIPRLTVAPFLAADGRAFMLALVPAIIVLVAHYLWVIRTEVAFEEQSVEHAQKRGARRLAMREGKAGARTATIKPRRDPFRLSARGRPEIAFLWKNLLSTVSYFRPRVAVIAAVLIVIVCKWLASSSTYRPFAGVILALATAAAFMTVLLGPQLARQDLRADLLNADLLKTYPLRGSQIVMGQLLTPLAVLTVIFWLSILAVAMALPERAIAGLAPSLRTGVAIGLALLAPPVCALQLLVQNAVVLAFPAWVQTVGNRAERGLDVLGQRIIFLAGQLLIAALGLLPAVLGAALLFLVTQWVAGPVVAATISFLGVLGILGAEVWIGVRLIGAQFERFDLSAELQP
jgi:ABC-2 type transport system permease protein